MNLDISTSRMTGLPKRGQYYYYNITIAGPDMPPQHVLVGPCAGSDALSSQRDLTEALRAMGNKVRQGLAIGHVIQPDDGRPYR